MRKTKIRQTSGIVAWTFESVMSDGSDVDVEFSYTAYPEVPEDRTERGYSRGTPAEPAHAEITGVRPINLTTEVMPASEPGKSRKLVNTPVTADKAALYREWVNSLLAMDENLEAEILDRCLEDAAERHDPANRDYD